MLKRHRLLIIAAIGIVAIVGLLWVGFDTKPKCAGVLEELSGGERPQEATNSNYSSSVTCERDCQVTFFRRHETDQSAEAEGKKTNAKCDTAEELDLLAQQQMAHWTFYIALLTGAGVLLLIGTLAETAAATRAAGAAANATHTTNEITREIGEAQSRAYLAARKGWLRVNTHTGEVDFGVELFNFGNSPATDVRFYGMYGIGSRTVDIPRKGRLKKIKKVREIPVNLYRELRGGLTIGSAEPEFVLALRGNIYLFIAGNVTYRDVFGREKRTKVAVSGFTTEKPADKDGYIETELTPTNPGVWDKTGNADPE